ncbi:MAG: alanine--tRNA ligase [Candidatus Omnitrophota bacterium]
MEIRKKTNIFRKKEIIKMTSYEIRKRFLDFFKNKGHIIVTSDLLVPENDPTLLFTGAGMNQFKEQFMGRNIKFKRVVSCQKCLRTGDLDNVGRTPRHHTFFEMLGNFSFGDYFKQEAIEWAWEFMTKEMALPEEKLWVSVYKDDEESYSIWRDNMKVSAGKIVKLGPSDNFWPQDAPTQGPNGPCGPCSEIFYDWGEAAGCGKANCDLSCDCGRFVEIWNLVFTEFERKSDGNLVALPSKNIDTGMGLERIVSVMQNVRNNFDTDLFDLIIAKIKREIEITDSPELKKQELNLIADHIRAVTFSVADGVSPSNEKRGYVIRKLIRRAYLQSGKKEPFLYNLVPVIAQLMGDVYPEIKEKREHISAIVKQEEEKFIDTLNSALPILDEMLRKARKHGVLGGNEIFKLADTYGLPVDVILRRTEGINMSLDMDGFLALMDEQKELSRKGSDISGEFIFSPDRFKNAPNPHFSEELPLETEIEFILKKDAESGEITEGEYGEIIVSPQSSKFYAESGGQAGDKGSLEKKGSVMKILNTFEAGGRKILGVYAEKGSFAIKDKVVLNLDFDRKAGTSRNHTATHLLQAALRSVLGEQVRQAGSFVDDKKLRFDFTYMKKVSERELAGVEDIVNTWISEDISVTKEEKSLKEAKEEGALSFFGEKYEDIVRVVGIGECSKELCGGAHVDNTKDIGLFKIISESSVASGIRRIEAVTHEDVEIWIKENLKKFLEEIEKSKYKKEAGIEKEMMNTASGIVRGTIKIDKVLIHDFSTRIRPLFLEARERLEKIAKKYQKQKQADVFGVIQKKMDALAVQPELIGDICYFSDVFDDIDMSLLRKAAGYLEKKIESGIVLLASRSQDKAYLICTVTRDMINKVVNAKEIIDAVAGYINGGGGGKDSFAQAGGKNPAGLAKALERAREIISNK